MLDSLFYPKSVAVVGASQDSQKVGYAVLKNLQKFGYQGKICPINPKAEEILKIPVAVRDYIKESVRPFLEKRGIAVFGALHSDILLDAISVRQLNEILGGKVLCCEEGVDEFIESFSIGAMDVDSALKYFRRTPNKAVITGAHRSDIQLAALETSTRCIVLTGGLVTNDVIIGKAKMTNTPIISVHDDTFATVQKIEEVLGKVRIREQKKVQKTKEIMQQEFDFARLLKELKLE